MVSHPSPWTFEIYIRVFKPVGSLIKVNQRSILGILNLIIKDLNLHFHGPVTPHHGMLGTVGCILFENEGYDC